MFLWLFLVVPWVCLQFVIVVFPDHTHLPFLKRLKQLPILDLFAVWASKVQYTYYLARFNIVVAIININPYMPLILLASVFCY